ncbi:hypothetical protein [Chelatococcus sp.]|nr:hypothetical protein [Chelatococcus sp.]
MKNEKMIAVTKAGRVARIAAFKAVGAFFPPTIIPACDINLRSNPV